jgi:hypothetical protein
MEAGFFDSLFEGDSCNGIKLGMGVTCGDFWPRTEQCQVLYRGASIEIVDFAKVLNVSAVDSETIAIPDYIPHTKNTGYYYVIRRVNNCGQQEQTLLVAIKVGINSNGDLEDPKPNSVFDLLAKQIRESKAELFWCYWPVEQGSKPIHFNVYWDNGTGQIDYENAIATIKYCKKKFYSYQSSSLVAGKHTFVVGAEDAGGVEGNRLQTAIQINTSNPESVEILSTEAI